MHIDQTSFAKPEARRGRGALSNQASGRFDHLSAAPFDDGWNTAEETPPALKTTVTADFSKTVITYNSSPDIPFDRSINPYRGCEHGCTYCFARPTHAFLGLSPGLDFETRLFAKPEAARLVEKEISAPGYKMRPIAFGTNTDPYQPIERDWRITRQVLEVLARARHPFSIVTKSHLVTRDIDILAPMAERGLVKVFLSVTSLNSKLSRAMEPRAATPGRRIEALRALSAAGIPTGVMIAPVVPALNDHELEWIVAAAADAGALWANHILLRLPYEVKALFREWLHEHCPDRAARVMRLLGQMRGGKDNDPRFGHRMRGQGPYAAMIRKRMRIACQRHGLNRSEIKLDLGQFHPPRPESVQLSLF